jgi:hypothetical protein
LYLSALQQAFEALCQLEPVRLDAPTALHELIIGHISKTKQR